LRKMAASAGRHKCIDASRHADPCIVLYLVLIRFVYQAAVACCIFRQKMQYQQLIPEQAWCCVVV